MEQKPAEVAAEGDEVYNCYEDYWRPSGLTREYKANDMTEVASLWGVVVC